VSCAYREEKAQVRFPVPLKSPAEMPIAAEFPPRAHYVLPQRQNCFCQPPMLKIVSGEEYLLKLYVP